MLRTLRIYYFNNIDVSYTVVLIIFIMLYITPTVIIFIF